MLEYLCSARDNIFGTSITQSSSWDRTPSMGLSDATVLIVTPLSEWRAEQHLRLQLTPTSTFWMHVDIFSPLELTLRHQIRNWGNFWCEVWDEPIKEFYQSTKLFDFPNTLKRLDFPDFVDMAIIGLNLASLKSETEKHDFLRDIHRLDFINGEPLVNQAIVNCTPTLLTLTSCSSLHQ